MVAASNLPAPLTDGELIQSASLSDVPDAESLAAWLLDKGLDTADWGKDNTKGVSKFWKEIKLNEAALELWRAADGSLIPVRTTHVLRAKVTSPDRYERGIFLFNTWQQYGDGRTRTRNGLLSEKLTTDEMPLEENLHEVCRRAVTEEEMQRVVESTMKIGLGRPAPEYDPNYTCPLEVVNEHFVDHIIELEKSKSYPGLLTMYHLYTVDIVCTGLPLTDLNTLEFEHPDKDGKRKLKYIHAWVWLEWLQIQRYLFEGSELKETKRKGRRLSWLLLSDSGSTWRWLFGFQKFQLFRVLVTVLKAVAKFQGLILLWWAREQGKEKWGKGTLKSVEALFKEIENEDSLLELWGRHDGVPMLMRVTHVLQLRVTSPEPSLKGKFLFSTWAELLNGKRRVTHTLPAMKLTLKDMPYDEEKFRASAAALATGFAIKYFLFVTEQLNHVVDIHYRSLRDSEPSGVQLHEVRGSGSISEDFVEQRHDVEESPSYRPGIFPQELIQLLSLSSYSAGVFDLATSCRTVVGTESLEFRVRGLA
ncbi:HERC2 [Symbiodinium necroappetens]|uniref:HERC2 protein n=1 Tax=Symbiodinium necroappetens TaxID=1628268 RepID=A0A812S2E1_9DINO|nr:HERC2 [Symbiodinium necroappetens]